MTLRRKILPGLLIIPVGRARADARARVRTLHNMRFIKNFLINLAILLGAILVLYLIYPAMMGQIIKAYGMLFGPVGILAIIVFALPRRRG
jgi:hypothetical protein